MTPKALQKFHFVVIVDDDHTTIILSTTGSKPSSSEPGRRLSGLGNEFSFPFVFNFIVHTYLHILFCLLLHLTFLDDLFYGLVHNIQRGKKGNPHIIQHFAS
ncbi:hypothetical protein AMTRI_Chr07g26050 [Amborella trichopoda]